MLLRPLRSDQARAINVGIATQSDPRKTRRRVQRTSCLSEVIRWDMIRITTSQWARIANIAPELEVRGTDRCPTWRFRHGARVSRVRLSDARGGLRSFSQVQVTIQVLYIHTSGTFGGASRSLLEMLKGFPEASVEAHVLSQHGPVQRMLADNGAAVVAARGICQFDNTRYGYYRGLRWLILLRECFYLWPTIAALRASKRQWPDIDVIHVNELTAIPAAVVAKKLFDVPLVVHVRSVQRPMEGDWRGRLLRVLVCRHVDGLVAIDSTVRASLPDDLPVQIIHNGFPRTRTEPGENTARARTTGVRRPLRVGFVGVLLALKGVYDLVEAARICVERGLDVEFIIAGENARPLRGIKGYLLKQLKFSADVRGDLERYIDEHGLQGRVRLVGFTPDVKSIYESLDVLCFPSHLDACGRPVFEAAFSRVPSIVAVSAPKEDTMIDGETGLCVTPRDPAALANAIEHFHDHPEELERMGEAAYQLALRNFDSRRNSALILELYGSLIRDASAKAKPAAGPSRHCQTSQAP